MVQTRTLVQGLLLVFSGCCLRVISAIAYSSQTSCTRANPRVSVKYNDTLHRGVATSPDWPGNYPYNLNCTYRLEVSYGYRMVVTFENFTMQPKDSGRDCEKDFIVVRDGDREAYSRFVGRFCGSERPKPFLSSGRFVWIYFVTDNTFIYQGFRVTFKPKHEAVIATCSKENKEIKLFGAHGNISSPSYPGLYPPDRTCQWTLTAPHGHFVNLTFLKFESRCPDDKMTISDINPGGQRLGEHCGNKLPPTFYRGRKLAVEFVSDETLAEDEDGFYGIYEMIPFNRSIEERCRGGNHRSLAAKEGGVIRSPWYPDLYPNDINCQWHILAPVGERVKISFDAFDLEYASECTTDYVEITDPISTSGPLRFCGGTTPKDFEADGEVVKVRFRTDNNKRRRGFVARYGINHGERSTLPCVRALLLALVVAVATLHRMQ